MARNWFAGFDSVIVTDVGALANLAAGAHSLFALIKPNAANHGWIQLRSGGSPVRSLFVDNGKINTENDFSGGPNVATGGWVIIGYSQPAGASACTYWYFDGANWSSQSGPINAPNVSIIDEVWLGKAYNRGSGDAAVLGAFATAIDPSASAMDLQLQAWVNLGAVALWPLDQSDPGEVVLDVTTNGADQLSVIGENPALADDPPGFDYTLDTGGDGGQTGGVSVTFMNFGAIVSGIGACACAGLEEAGIPVCTCYEATIGPAPWDACDCVCEDGTGRGQLGAYAGPIFPSDSFPNPAPPGMFDHACGPRYLVANIGIQIARCVPAFDASLEDKLAASLAWHTDATIIRQAVGCCLRSMRNNRQIARYAIGATTVLPEQGQCAGSELTIQVGLPHCSCG